MREGVRKILPLWARPVFYNNSRSGPVEHVVKQFFQETDVAGFISFR